ncbi:MAG: twin transmembrane helix small protein [Alphaproteobacteria bacterium]|nr:twin transmembrane helix small protein [Alphaproteobacteria bacterium]
MSPLGMFLLIGLMLAVVGVLVTGMVLMVRGGEANRKYGNKMMVTRVALQGAALVVVGLLLWLRHSS